MDKQLAERKVEPNSGLGKAIRYMQNHWPKLTLFLHKAGAPLDTTHRRAHAQESHPPSKKRPLL